MGSYKNGLKRVAELSVAAAAIAVMFAGCGGGSSSSGVAGGGSVTLSGFVADGYIGGAKVCLDVGNDGMCDPTDPSATTTASGAYSLSGISAASAAAHPLLAEIPATATDTDLPAGSSVGMAYTLATPAGKTFISPLTAMVKAKMDAGSSVAEAEASVKSTLGITAASVFDDYIAGTSPDHSKAHGAGRVVARLFREGLAALGGTTLDTATLQVLMGEAESVLQIQAASGVFDPNQLPASAAAGIPAKVLDRRYDAAVAAGSTGMRLVTIPFGVLAQDINGASAVLGDAICAKQLALGAQANAANAASAPVAGQVNDLRFYVSNIMLIDHDGVKHPMVLEENAFQHRGVALLDFETASAPTNAGTLADASSNKCTGGTPETHMAITGWVPDGLHYHGIAFELGVPVKSLGSVKEEMNHSNPASASGPLAVTAMNWNWQGGRKFTKIQYVPDAGLFNGASAVAATTWNFHLGSTSCSFNPAVSGVTPAGYECGAPNRVPFTLMDDVNGFVDAVSPGSALTALHTVVLDLIELFRQADLSQETGGAAGCMSGPTDPQCPAMFNALQLKAGQPTGTPSNVFVLR